MSNTKSSPKNLNGLLVIACVTLFGLMGTVQSISAQSAASQPGIADANAFVPWDGGFAAVRKKFTASVSVPVVTNDIKSPAAKSASAAPAATLAGLVGSQVINWSFNLDNMLRRMGEVRLENLDVNTGGDLHYNGNIWARAYGDRVNASSDITGAAFHEYTYGASIGADKTLSQTRDLTVLAGLMGDFSKTTRTFNAGGTGSTQNTGVGLYVSLLAADGWFADLAGSYAGIKTKFTTPAAPADISGSYTTEMETLSLEVGRVFKRADGWWVEPSLQAAIAWAGSGACTPTPDTHVAIGGARDYQYRAAIRFGRQLAATRLYPYARFAIARVNTTGGIINVLGAEPLAPDYNAIRGEFGLGAVYRVNEVNQLYLDYNYSKASNYDSPWGANLGYRLLW